MPTKRPSRASPEPKPRVCRTRLETISSFLFFFCRVHVALLQLRLGLLIAVLLIR